MYHPLLTTRYLTSRVIPLIAVAAVALCVALVIVVISVMTGFLNMVRNSGRTLIGDVVISYSIAGIPHYERIIARLSANPAVAAAAPVVDSFGLLQMPYPDGPNKQTQTVQFQGIDSRFADVTSFADALYWKVPTDNQFLLLFADAFRAYANNLPAILSTDQKIVLFNLLHLPTSDVESVAPDHWGVIASYLASDPVLVYRTLTPDQWNALLHSDPRLVSHAALAALILADPSVILSRLDASSRLTLFNLWIDQQRPRFTDDERRAAIADPPADWSAFLTRSAFSYNAIRAALSDQHWQQLVALDSRLAQPNALLTQGLTLSRNGKPAAVLGMHVSEGNDRNHLGGYDVARDDFWWMPRFNLTLTTLPVHGGAISAEPESFIFPVANEFISGVYLIDDKRIMIPLDVAQKMLHMDKSIRVDEIDPSIELGEEPARVSMILVRAAPGISADALQNIVADEYSKLADELSAQRLAADSYLAPLPPYFKPLDSDDRARGGVSIQTWEQQQAAFIGPVEKERELMRTLFSIVYFVCAALVLSIFWAIVYEKTRDIGILRSIGASRAGIIWIFLRYGLVVGIFGAILGALLAALVIHNINAIHSTLGSPPLSLAIVFAFFALAVAGFSIYRGLAGGLLPLVLGSVVFAFFAILAVGVYLLHQRGGIVVWDPAVYYFSVIPNQVDLTAALTTMIGAVIFSLLGAVIPAAKAADTDPVHALRYE